jgi:hypothetical protein
MKLFTIEELSKFSKKNLKELEHQCYFELFNDDLMCDEDVNILHENLHNIESILEFGEY